jgi:hypothetical protein
MGNDRQPPKTWSARIYRLGEEPRDDLSSQTTAEERLEMMAILSRRMWELSGRPIQEYPRAAMPVRIIHLP